MPHRRAFHLGGLMLVILVAGCSNDNVTGTGQAGAAAQLAFTSIPSGQVVGAVLNPAVQVAIEDANGNVVTTSTSSVTIAIQAGPGGAAFSGSTTVAAAAGYAVFPALMLNDAGIYTLSATSTGLTGAASNSFTVVSQSASVVNARH
jgi:hypothetical protein